MTYKVQIDDEIRDATPEEVAIIENEKEQLEQRIAEAEARAAAKAAAEAKLGALGLTADDLKALGL
jgi:3-phenylpropionate/cinnamic acid dioxygenase small subunit